MTSTTYTIPKVKKGTNKPYYGLQVTSFLLPFPYFQTTDVVVAIRGNLESVSVKDDLLLVEGENYIIDGSRLILHEESLGLRGKDSLSIKLNASRNTALDLAVFAVGHPVKAGDLNHNFEQLVYKMEENNTLILNNTHVSDTAPVNPYQGQHWLRTPYYTEYIFTGNEWVQPQ